VCERRDGTRQKGCLEKVKEGGCEDAGEGEEEDQRRGRTKVEKRIVMRDVMVEDEAVTVVRPVPLQCCAARRKSARGGEGGRREGSSRCSSSSASTRGTCEAEGGRVLQFDEFTTPSTAAERLRHGEKGERARADAPAPTARRRWVARVEVPREDDKDDDDERERDEAQGDEDELVRARRVHDREEEDRREEADEEPAEVREVVDTCARARARSTSGRAGGSEEGGERGRTRNPAEPDADDDLDDEEQELALGAVLNLPVREEVPAR